MPGRGSADSDAQHAGRVLWPRSAADLTDTTICPACLTPLPSPVCPSCGLDLRHPAAAALLEASTDAAAALNRRVSLIGRIRFDAAQSAQVLIAQSPPASSPLSVPRGPTALPGASPDIPSAWPPPSASAATSLAPPAPAPSTYREPAPAPVSAAPSPGGPGPGHRPAAGPTRPKRSSVQVLLLLVGVSLVSVAAIFFLTVAWLFAGLEVRSAIVALLTAAALVTAAILSRKGLAATAEGIGALSVVLVLLDAWAMRENNLFGLADADGPTYWGVALLASAALFLGWHALSRLRVAGVAGFAVAAPGLGLLVAGFAVGQPDSTRAFLGFLGTAIGALIHRLTLPGDSRLWPSLDRAAERMTLLGVGGLALLAASVTAAFAQPDWIQAPLWTFGAVAIVAALHAVVIVTTPRPEPAYRVFAYGCAGLAALVVTLAAPLLARRADDSALGLTAPILVAAALALALELFLRRRAPGPLRTALLGAAATAAAMAASYALFVVEFAVQPLADALRSGLTRAGDPVAQPQQDNAWALAALAGVGVLVALFWALGGILRARGHLVAWFAGAVVVLAVPFAASLWLVLPTFLALGALSLAALLLAARGRLPLGLYRPVVVALLVLTEAAGYLVGWASTDSWWVGSISAVLVLFLARLLFDSMSAAAARAALLAGAILLTLVAAGTAPWALTLGLHPSFDANLVNVVRGLTLATALLQVAVAVAWRGFTASERRWAFWTLLGPTAVAFSVPVGLLADALPANARATLLQGEPAAGIWHAALLLAAPCSGSSPSATARSCTSSGSSRRSRWPLPSCWSPLGWPGPRMLRPPPGPSCSRPRRSSPAPSHSRSAPWER